MEGEDGGSNDGSNSPQDRITIDDILSTARVVPDPSALTSDGSSSNYQSGYDNFDGSASLSSSEPSEYAEDDEMDQSEGASDEDEEDFRQTMRNYLEGSMLGEQLSGLTDNDDDRLQLASEIERVMQGSGLDLSHLQQLVFSRMGKKTPTSCRPLDGHDLNQEIAMKSGSTGDSKSFTNMCRFLKNREKRTLGSEFCGHFNSKGRIQLSQRMIPNCHVGYLARLRNNAFNGQFTRDGQIFVSSSSDQIIRLFDTRDINKPVLYRRIQARDVGWNVIDTAFSPNSQYLIYSSWSKYVHLASMDPNSTLHEPLLFCEEPHHSFCPFSIKFSPDNNEIVAAGNDQRMYIYDLSRREVVEQFQSHEDDVNSICFADENDPHIIFSGSDDASIKVWDRRMFNANAYSSVGHFQGHNSGITFVSSKGDSRYLISNSKDQSIKLWDMRKMGCGVPRDNPVASNWDYRWQACPSRIGAASHPNDLSLMTYTGHKVMQTLIRCQFSPAHTTAQKYIVTGSFDGSAYIYDVLDGTCVSVLRGHTEVVRDVSWHPHEQLIATSSWDCSHNLYALPHQKKIRGPMAAIGQTADEIN